MGVTPAIYARIADSLTVHSRQPGVNAQHAPRDVLLALPNATPELVDAFIEQRTRRAGASCRCRRFRRRQLTSRGAVPVWRIRAVATAPDGVTFVREAVVRPSGDGRRPLLTLNWQEARAMHVPADAQALAAADLVASRRNDPKHATAAGKWIEPTVDLGPCRYVMASMPGAFARPRAPAGIAAFCAWWMRELAAIVPAAPRAASQRRRMRPVLVFDARSRDALASR